MTSKREEIHELRRRARGTGFTLVELMVTVSILAILLAVGVPQLRNFMLKQQVAADVETLSMAIQLAKTEAIKRSGRVSLCPLASAITTPPACAAESTKDWSAGWMVYLDQGSPTAGYDADRDTIVRVQQGSRSGSVIYIKSISKLTFEGNGLLASNQGSFDIQPPGDSVSPLCKQVSLTRQGRVQTQVCDKPTT